MFKNSPFEDYPIEFKEINSTDFPEFKVDAKKIIKPDEKGFITTELLSSIELDSKNTIVINAAVGQGKTYSIIEIVKQYFNSNEDYLVFIVSPFVSLIEQYHQKLINQDILEKDIFRYELLGTEKCPNYLEKSIHIVTANCLLGNPGDDALINSKAKREYINTLSSFCQKTNKKVIFIYDEIHDAIHNFKEKYIFNLWKWKNSIHKNYVISATFNEASKIVIEYLAELTDDKIQIVESLRIRNKENQSDLNLHYCNSQFFNNETPELVNLIQDLIKRDKEIDILCFSKTLSLSIIENKTEGAGKLLYQKYDKINNCTSDFIKDSKKGKTSPQNRYNPTLCNVGTNFKSGVSIEKDNHAFVIILPPNGAKMPFQNFYGIFSNGINSIIQALARQRKKGEIHLLLPLPDKINYISFPFSNDKKKFTFFKNVYENICNQKDTKELIEYNSLAKQRDLLYEFYSNELKGNVINEIQLVQNTNRVNKVRLEFPEFKLFVLEDGEIYLANKFQFFGGDLSAYITYSAITNQFINCTLNTIISKKVLVLDENNMESQLINFYNTYYYEETHQSYFIYLNDPLYFKVLKDTIFKETQIIFKVGDKFKTIKKNGKDKTSKQFEAVLLNLVRKYKRKNYTDINETNQLLSNYLSESISLSLNSDSKEYSQYNKAYIESFKYLNVLRERMIKSINSLQVKGENINYLSQDPSEDFIPLNEEENFKNLINFFSTEENPIMIGMLNLSELFKGKTLTSQKKEIYKLILKLFFETELYRLPTGKRERVKKITKIKELPNPDKVFNWLIKPDYDFPEGFFTTEMIEEGTETIKSILNKN